ncbi:MAG: four helix bundle protein [Planctomycetota bacterium]
MAAIGKYEDIEAWKHARDLTLRTYELFRRSNLQREFGLKDQMTRSALSAMNNIAEGFGRKGNKEFLRFLSIAQGSAYETQSMYLSVQVS